MKLIRNLLALIGLVALLVIGYGYFRLAPTLSEFDPGFMSTYSEFAGKLLESGVSVGEIMRVVRRSPARTTAT